MPRGYFTAWRMTTGSQQSLSRRVRLCGISFDDSAIGTVSILCDDHVICTLTAANKNASLPQIGGKMLRCEGTAGVAVIVHGYEDRRKRCFRSGVSSIGKQRKMLRIGGEHVPLGLSQDRLARADEAAGLPGPNTNAYVDSDIDTEADLYELSCALDLDRNGRIGRIKGLSYETTSWHGFLSAERAEQAKADCMVLEDRKAHDDQAAQPATFWMPADGTARFGLERLAHEIFSFHTKSVAFDPARSGAEWWVQVRSASADPIAAGSQHLSGGADSSAAHSSSIGFHWDMDLGVMESHGLALHPHLSTVTYLTDAGHPTGVVETRRPDLEAGVKLTPNPSVYLSYPSVRKHLRFDGRFLHGVPATPPGASAATSATTIAAPRSALRSAMRTERTTAAAGGGKPTHRAVSFAPLAIKQGPFRTQRTNSRSHLQLMDCNLRCTARGRGHLRQLKHGAMLEESSAPPLSSPSCVPATRRPAAAPEPPPLLRVTFLVNIWLGYTPAGCRRFDETASPPVAPEEGRAAKAAALHKRQRKLLCKLHEIEGLESQRARGAVLQANQQTKLATATEVRDELLRLSLATDAALVNSTESEPPTGVGASAIDVTASEAGSAAPTYATYPIMWVDAAVDVQMRLPVLPSQSLEGKAKGATVALSRDKHAQPVFEHLLHAP